MTSQISQQNSKLPQWVRSLAILPLAAIAAVGVIGPSEADPASLAGSWSGGGWVSFSSGAKEKARCHANYSKAGGDAYSLSATCATASGKASQTATVYKVSEGRYRGSFHNAEFNISGSIRVAVHGKTQDVSLAGEGASASLSLSRR
jgi:hypothetical protein